MTAVNKAVQWFELRQKAPPPYWKIRSLTAANWHRKIRCSDAKHLSEELEIPYVQEVVANSIALKAMYGEIGTAIELGGQDAKIIFFQRDKRTGELQVTDMRLSGIYCRLRRLRL